MVSSVILRLKKLVSDFIRPFKAFNSKWIKIKAKYTVEIYSRNRLLAFFSTFGKENVSIHVQDNSDIRTRSTRPTSLNIWKALIIRIYRGSTCSGNDFLQFVKRNRYENPQHKPRNEENQKLAVPPKISCNGCVPDDSGPHNYTLKIPINQLESFIKTDTQNNHICVKLSNWLICSTFQIKARPQHWLEKKLFKTSNQIKVLVILIVRLDHGKWKDQFALG